MARGDIDRPRVTVRLEALHRFWKPKSDIYVNVQIAGSSVDADAWHEIFEETSASLARHSPVSIQGWVPVHEGWHGRQVSTDDQAWSPRQHWFETFASVRNGRLSGYQHATVTSGPIARPSLASSDRWELAATIGYPSVDPLRLDATIERRQAGHYRLA